MVKKKIVAAMLGMSLIVTAITVYPTTRVEATTIPNGTTVEDHKDIEMTKMFISSSSKDGSGILRIESYVTSGATLDDTAGIEDVVSPYYQISGEVVVKTADCTGYSGEVPMWSGDVLGPSELQPVVEDNRVLLTGFNYKNYWVGKESVNSERIRRKVILEIPIKPLEGFIGGNGVPTNISTTFTFEGEVLESISSPTVDVPIELSVAVSDQTIYLGDAVNGGRLLGLEDTFDGVKNTFVNVLYDIYQDLDKDGVVDYSDKRITGVKMASGSSNPIYLGKEEFVPTECGNYLVQYLVSPTIASGQASVFGASAFAIHVLRPDFSVKDIYANYGAEIDMSKDNIATVPAYSESCDCEGALEASGEKPTLSIRYTTETGNVIEENTSNGADFVAEKDQTITATICTNDNPTTITRDFKVTLNRYNLEITKSVDVDKWAGYEQDIIVNVIQNDSPTRLVFGKEELSSSGSVTKIIEGLYAGAETTVLEDTDWAWRWNPQYVLNSEGSNVTKIADNKFRVSGEQPKSETAQEVPNILFSVNNSKGNSKWSTASEFIRNMFGINTMGGDE